MLYIIAGGAHCWSTINKCNSIHYDIPSFCHCNLLSISPLGGTSSSPPCRWERLRGSRSHHCGDCNENCSWTSLYWNQQAFLCVHHRQKHRKYSLHGQDLKPKSKMNSNLTVLCNCNEGHVECQIDENHKYFVGHSINIWYSYITMSSFYYCLVKNMLFFLLFSS